MTSSKRALMLQLHLIQKVPGVETRKKRRRIGRLLCLAAFFVSAVVSMGGGSREGYALPDSFVSGISTPAISRPPRTRGGF